MNNSIKIEDKKIEIKKKKHNKVKRKKDNKKKIIFIGIVTIITILALGLGLGLGLEKSNNNNESTITQPQPQPQPQPIFYKTKDFKVINDNYWKVTIDENSKDAIEYIRISEEIPKIVFVLNPFVGAKISLILENGKLKINYLEVKSWENIDLEILNYNYNDNATEGYLNSLTKNYEKLFEIIN